MKHPPLKSPHYRLLETSYRLYLDILGYAPATVRLWPVHIRELLHYLEGHGIDHIGTVQGSHVQGFIHHLKTRPHQKVAGCSLSSSSINNTLNAIAVFLRYLHHSGRQAQGWTLQREPAGGLHPTVLTITEVRQLYEATFDPYRENTLSLG